VPRPHPRDTHRDAAEILNATSIWLFVFLGNIACLRRLVFHCLLSHEYRQHLLGHTKQGRRAGGYFAIGFDGHGPVGGDPYFLALHQTNQIVFLHGAFHDRRRSSQQTP